MTITEISKDMMIEQSSIHSWKPEDAQALYDSLEEDSWAPWLAAGVESIAGRAVVFPEGQLIMNGPDGTMLASVSTNLITWDGEVETLPTWDAVAGDPTDYSQTYEPDGNTLVLLSMNVNQAYKGMQLPGKMIDKVVHTAHQLGVAHVIGSFRPSGYGEAKKQHHYNLPFEHYIGLTRDDGSGKPVDPWLGSLWHKGMEMLAVDEQAMTVPVSMQEFASYQAAYKPDMWHEIAAGVWECGEVGKWTVDTQQDVAVYQESNVWGSIPLP